MCFFFKFLVTNPPRGRPFGGGGVHRLANRDREVLRLISIEFLEYSLVLLGCIGRQKLAEKDLTKAMIVCVAENRSPDEGPPPQGLSEARRGNNFTGFYCPGSAADLFGCGNRYPSPAKGLPTNVVLSSKADENSPGSNAEGGSRGRSPWVASLSGEERGSPSFPLKYNKKTELSRDRFYNTG
jgi:hypothetical protein